MRVRRPRVALLGLLGALVLPTAVAAPQAQLDRGAYLFKVGGCGACHSPPDAPLAGGVKLDTPFGTFYTPNISPDRETGIGGWSDRQFIRAVKQGLSPGGEHYYPAFPYTSYTRMSDRELIDLKAYLDSRPAIRRQNRPHELAFPFDQRWLLGLWKALFFDAGEFKPSPIKSGAWNRGAYLVSGPGHCVECHTPRNLLGGLDRDRPLMGNPEGPDGEAVPAINAAWDPAFGRWQWEDIQFALEAGVTPSGDVVGGTMAHVVDNTTSQLTPEDLAAVTEFLAHPL